MYNHGGFKYIPLGTVCYIGCAQMNIIKNPGSEPIMTVAMIGNKRSGHGGSLNQLCSDFNPNNMKPYGSANLCA